MANQLGTSSASALSSAGSESDERGDEESFSVEYSLSELPSHASAAANEVGAILLSMEGREDESVMPQTKLDANASIFARLVRVSRNSSHVRG